MTGPIEFATFLTLGQTPTVKSSRYSLETEFLTPSFDIKISLKLDESPFGELS